MHVQFNTVTNVDLKPTFFLFFLQDLLLNQRL